VLILRPLFGEYLFVLILRVPLLLLDQFICVILRPFREYLLVVPPRVPLRSYLCYYQGSQLVVVLPRSSQ
jgi:hypothetical protein